MNAAREGGARCKYRCWRKAVGAGRKDDGGKLWARHAKAVCAISRCRQNAMCAARKGGARYKHRCRKKAVGAAREGGARYKQMARRGWRRGTRVLAESRGCGTRMQCAIARWWREAVGAVRGGGARYEHRCRREAVGAARGGGARCKYRRRWEVWARHAKAVR